MRKGGLPVMRSDDELYRSFLSGDPSSYDELMIRYGDSLTIFLNGYHHDWGDSEDLMIEAFARIMVKKPRIREGGFKAYLYKTARNLSSRFHSKTHRADVFSLEGMETELKDSFSLEDELQDKERKRVLHLCLERIDPEMREALWLIYFEDMSYAQAASVMGVNNKRVDKLLQRGKIHLRTELEKEGISNAI